jgi:hypothetical protein
MKRNLLRVKLLLAAALLTTAALQPRASASACHPGQFITSTEQECLSLCDSRGCNYAYDGDICTCSHG